ALRGGLSGPNRGRGVSYFTLRWLSKKCMGTKGVQREHAHASAKTGITSQSVAKVAQTGARQPQRKKFQNVQQYAPFSARRRQYPRPWPSAPFHLGEPGLQWRTGADVGGDRLGLCREAAAAWRSIYEASRSPRRDCRSCWPRSRPWAELGMASTPWLC